jgi:hypothetical protein
MKKKDTQRGLSPETTNEEVSEATEACSQQIKKSSSGLGLASLHFRHPRVCYVAIMRCAIRILLYPSC